MKKPTRMEMELREGANSQIRELREEMDQLETAIPFIPPPTTNADIVNIIPNSDWNWSHDAFLNPGITPATAGDDNNRAFNWYRIERATALMVEDNAHSLKGPTHSLAAAESTDTPQWSKTNGWAELGEAGGVPWDICCPIPNNVITPSMRFLLQMIFRLRTATALPGVIEFFWSLWDNTNTVPAPRIIQGSAFDLSGGVFGPLGATTRTYKLIVDTDQGGQVESDVLVINNAPAVLSASNGVGLTWDRYPGFTNVTIYVTVGGASFIVGIVGNGAAAFTDTGQDLGPVGSVPSVTDTVAKAQAVAHNFVPTQDWQHITFSIFVPQTYNYSLTTGRQWLRGGVLGLMGDGRQLQIDRIGLSTGNGVWAAAAFDQNAKSPSSTSQTSSTQGPPFSGAPPDDGEGRVNRQFFDQL